MKITLTFAKRLLLIIAFTLAASSAYAEENKSECGPCPAAGPKEKLRSDSTKGNCWYEFKELEANNLFNAVTEQTTHKACYSDAIPMQDKGGDKASYVDFYINIKRTQTASILDKNTPGPFNRLHEKLVTQKTTIFSPSDNTTTVRENEYTELIGDPLRKTNRGYSINKAHYYAKTTLTSTAKPNLEKENNRIIKISATHTLTSFEARLKGILIATWPEADNTEASFDLNDKKTPEDNFTDSCKTSFQVSADDHKSWTFSGSCTNSNNKFGLPTIQAQIPPNTPQAKQNFTELIGVYSKLLGKIGNKPWYVRMLDWEKLFYFLTGRIS